MHESCGRCFPYSLPYVPFTGQLLHYRLVYRVAKVSWNLNNAYIKALMIHWAQVERCNKSVKLFNLFWFRREALLSVSMNFFEEVDLGAGDVKVGTRCFLVCYCFSTVCLSVCLSACLSIWLLTVSQSDCLTDWLTFWLCLFDCLSVSLFLFDFSFPFSLSSWLSVLLNCLIKTVCLSAFLFVFFFLSFRFLLSS